MLNKELQLQLYSFNLNLQFHDLVASTRVQKSLIEAGEETQI